MGYSPRDHKETDMIELYTTNSASGSSLLHVGFSLVAESESDSSCSEEGYSSCGVWASLVAEHRLWSTQASVA